MDRSRADNAGPTAVAAAKTDRSRRVLVVAVGNPFRHDDGLGLAVLDRLVALAQADDSLAHADIVEESGEPVALISRWADYDSVIMIDAVSSGGQPGQLHRIECSGGNWDLGRSSARASTHGLGVAEAVALGRTLDRLPHRLVVLGLETADVSQGEGLSAPVAASLEQLIDAAVADIRSESALPVQVS